MNWCCTSARKARDNTIDCFFDRPTLPGQQEMLQSNLSTRHATWGNKMTKKGARLEYVGETSGRLIQEFTDS